MKVSAVYDLEVSKLLNPKKLRKKNRQNSQRFLNHIKSSYIFFCPKLFQYSQYIYIIRKKVSKQFGAKNHTRKVDEIHKDFEQYQILMHNFLWQNGYSHYLYYLQKKSTDFGLRVLTNFALEVSKHFGLKKSYKKN